LRIWISGKNARNLYIKVKNITTLLPLSKDYSLKDQVLRSCGSVMDNIAEGFERDGKKSSFSFYILPKDHWVKPGHKFTVAMIQDTLKQRHTIK